ncbi:hypothetical protein [Nocardia pseudovaccinii]|uniref:hypothetical protein n=1 Tax=Nocardia pseudovaccinii TaxID=189540 RepID=UPI000ADEF7D4|nr:hypothetical protein [Nocardia pseudovaccinii]
MPDEYDDYRRRERLTNYERGLYFELGRAHERGETAEKGWVRQFRIETKDGVRILDSARTEGRGTRGIERKSGRVNERETLRQLGLERLAFESGQLTSSTWETVAGEKVPPEVVKEMQAMARDFRGKFHHQVISRADALRAIQLGQSMVSKQLELVRAHELVRADRARKRLENIREIVRARQPKEREEPARERDGQHREKAPKSKALEREPLDPRARESDQDKPKPPSVTRERTDPTPKAQEVRERAETQARATVDSLGSFLTDAQKEQILAARRQERDNERDVVALEMKPVRGQEPPAPPPVPQRTPEQHENALSRAVEERERARAAAKEAGLSPEIMGILGLNSDDPPKMIDTDATRTHADSERDRAIHQQRERERSDRERESRHRSD